MQQMTREEALKQGYEFCIYSWGEGEDGVEDISMLRDKDFEGETIYLLDKEPLHVDDDKEEIFFPRLDIQLIP